MRRTRSTIDNVSENVIHDIWTEAMDVDLSNDPTGTFRFQILRTRLEGYIWVSGRPAKIQKITRPDSIWPEAWMQFSKNNSKKTCRLGGRKCQTAGSTPQRKSTRYRSMTSKDDLKVIADARLKFEKGLGPAMPFIMREDSNVVDYPLSQVDHKWHVGQR